MSESVGKSLCCTDPENPTLAEIVAVLSEVYTPKGVMIWLQHDMDGPGFEKCSPVWLIEHGKKARAVFDAARQLADGNFG